MKQNIDPVKLARVRHNPSVMIDDYFLEVDLYKVRDVASERGNINLDLTA